MSDTSKPTSILGVIRKGREARIAAEATANAPETTTEEKPVEKAAEIDVLFKAGSLDAERGVITAFASAAGIVDRDGDRISQDDLTSMAYGFTGSQTRVFKANHTDVLDKVELVGSIVGAPILKSGRTIALGEELPPQSDSDPRVAKGEAVDLVIGMNIEKGKATHWLVELDPHDPEIVEKAKTGGLAGLSVGIRASRTPAEA
ncbi:MAG: hypothetical protein JWM87_729 [Candidatus Eremiobacteraeota bacterium]|nr:hypothetical protein [Candidatus Eremiobacteraeota bacterium]